MKINANHTEFFENDTDKIILFYGGKGSGKSYTTVQKILLRIIQEDGHRILVMHKYFNKIRETVFQQFLDIIKEENLTSFFTTTKTPFRIRCKQNDSEIVFIGLDNEKIGSTAGITSVFCEEAHFLEEGDWVNLVASLGRAKKTKHTFQFILVFNPFGGTKHWLNKRFFMTNDYGATIYHTIWSDNIYLSDDYEKILDATKNNKAYYKAAKFGEFADNTDKTIFRNWSVYNPFIHKDISFNIKDYKNIAVGVDWGHRHAACALIVGRSADKLVVFDEVYETGLTTEQFIMKVISKQWRRDYPYYCDSANPDKILELSQHGFNASGVSKGDGSIAYSIDILLRHHIIILPVCFNLIEEIENYEYKQNVKTSEIFNMPDEHQMDDAVDALRYSIENLKEEKSYAKAAMALY